MYTWIILQKLENGDVSDRYIRCYYAMINVVSSVGSGDMFPVTDIGRVFFTLLMTVGDVFFALAFGMIASISLRNKESDETEQIISKMLEVNAFLNTNNVTEAQRERVEQYLGFYYI